MVEQINTELLKLQDELNKFDGAVKKITQAGEITDTLLENSKNLQESFAEQLKKIEGLFSDYMNKTYSHTEEKISKIFEHFQERLQQEEQTLEKFSNLTDQNSQLSQDFFEKIYADSNKQISGLVNEANQNLEEQKDFLNLLKMDFQKNLKNMIESHKEKIKSEQSVLDNYLELASSTAELSKFLKSVDFPKKLDLIQKNIDELKTKNSENFKNIETQNSVRFDKIDKYSSKIDKNTQNLIDDTTREKILNKVTKIYANDKSAEVLHSSQKLNSRVKGTKLFVILIFILTLLFYGFFTFTFLNFFPRFFEEIFK